MKHYLPNGSYIECIKSTLGSDINVGRKTEDNEQKVSVVYCKDCIYNVANSKHDPLDITDYTDITCEYFMTDGMDADDFCSQGRRVGE